MDPDKVVSRQPRASLLVWGVVAVVVAGGIFGIGYWMGSAHGGPSVTIQTGDFHSSCVEPAGPQCAYGVATAMLADGTSFGFQGTVPWKSTDGSWHDGDWPACLPRLGSAKDVRFGGIKLPGNSDSPGDWTVLWVDCAG
jgi:hypothetical protein